MEVRTEEIKGLLLLLCLVIYLVINLIIFKYRQSYCLDRLSVSIVD